MNAFLKGLASIFDFADAFGPEMPDWYEYAGTAEERDALALYGDWQAVLGDLNRVLPQEPKDEATSQRGDRGKGIEMRRNQWYEDHGNMFRKPYEDIPDGMSDDDEWPRPCTHPGHEFPSHLYIPPGKRYKHVCPGCGYTVVVRGGGCMLSAR